MSVEKAIEIQGRARLSAVMSPPPADAPATRLGVLFLSAGLLHRVGPFRLHVDLARRLAADGLTAVRLDLSGIGYSERSHEGADPLAGSEGAHEDVVAAMDYLERHHGLAEFVLVGLCAGATAAHYVATREARVVGAVFLDGYSFPTPRYYWHHYLTRAMSFAKWRSWLKTKLQGLFHRHDPIASLRRLADELWDIPTPPKDQLRAELIALRQRGARLLFVYAGGTGANSYPGQLADAFPGVVDGDEIQVQFYPLADHTYILADDRMRLIERVADWAGAFGEGR